MTLLRRGSSSTSTRVLRQALRAGVRSYSLKELEALYRLRAHGRRAARATTPSLAYERWLAHAARRAPRRDRRLQRGGLPCDARAARLAARACGRPSLAWPEPLAERELPEEESAAAIAERERLRLDLCEGEEPGSPRWLAGELLEYHRRESRPAWWAYFDRMSATPEELVDTAEAIGCLEPVGEPEPLRRSLVWTLSFREQEHKLEVDDEPRRPSDEEGAGTILELDNEHLTLRLMRGPSLASVALPRALVIGKPYDDRYQRAAVARLAESVRDATSRYPALEAVLRRETPRMAGFELGASVQTVVPAEIWARAGGLESSYLFVQGPPGTGKTWRGAEIVVELVSAGNRVGVTAQSHR